jgi:hypothetical protein
MRISLWAKNEEETKLLSRRLFLEQVSAASAFVWGKGVRSMALGSLGAAVEDGAVEEGLSDAWKSYGRIAVKRLPGSVIVQDGFALENTKWSDCAYSFEARAPKQAEQVQIWAGIKCRDRDCRYVFALRGGDNDDMYIARYGPEGAAKFLGIAPLGFHPEPGAWYKIKAVSRGNRLLIYLNQDELPRLNVVDAEVPWQEGHVSIGGGWLPAEYRSIRVKGLTAQEESAIDAMGEAVWQAPRPDKQSLRAQQRAQYQPLQFADSGEPRVEHSLDGNWLFLPDQELAPNEAPQSVAVDDRQWHIMDVPNFWTPTLSWLHGETGFPKLQGLSSSKGICDKFYEKELERLEGYTFDWRKTKGGWYRQYIDLHALAPRRRYEICFDAIAKVSDVWLNGVKVASHVGMFGEVCCDITRAAKPGRNVLAVHVQGGRPAASPANSVVGVAVTVEVTDAMLNSLPHGMYPNDASGIWQPVKLVVTNDVRIDDVFLIPNLKGLKFDLSVLNAGATPVFVDVAYAIRSRSDGSLLHEDRKAASLLVGPGSTAAHLSTPHLEPQPWSPHDPHLYDIEIAITSGGAVQDRRLLPLGFRTFSVESGKLFLNGQPFWMRGANHFPNALRPNDGALAKHFMELAKAGNVAVTRSHTVPFSGCWLDAADEVGVAVSFEGTWPWLMLEGPPPSPDLLQTWKSEFLSMIHKFRNHPSIILWTVNNEMKFPIFDRKNPGLLHQKWEILSDMVRAIRSADPTRPVICDSSYCRKEIGSEYEDVVLPGHFDDGDIDDAHRYFGWYEPTFYHYFRGEFGKSASYPGRPLISQEMSTGYPRNDDGHPTRFYLFQHHTPQSLVGSEAYENRDPAIFLRRQAFMTKELAETIRRTNRGECSGILHFSYVSWFQNVWNANTIRPFLTYYALRTALQPVLISAELYGRHFYAGARPQIRVCVVNDSGDRAILRGCKLTWQIRRDGSVLASGVKTLADVPYYANAWDEIQLAMPEDLPALRVDATLSLALEANGASCSENSYDIVVAKRAWVATNLQEPIAIFTPRGNAAQGQWFSRRRQVNDFDSVHQGEAVLFPDAETALKDKKIAGQLRRFVDAGGRALVLHAGAQLPPLFPDRLQSYRKCAGEIAHMHIPESPVFDGIEPLDLAWFEMGNERVPRACSGTYRLVPDRSDTTMLAEVVDIHGYLKTPADLAAISGSPLVELKIGKGKIFASEMMLLESVDDPIAARLVGNLMHALQSGPHEE